MKNNTTVFSIVLFLSILIMNISCGKQSAKWRGSIEEEDGITVVKNPKEPIYSEDIFSLEEELSIGEAEGREEYMFSEIISITVNDEEDIYVLDIKEKHVKIFDKNGEHVKTFGKQGQGPGELQIPRSIVYTNQNEIMAGDINRLSFFSLDGEFKKSISTAKMWLMSAKIDSEGNIVGIAVIRETENPRYELKKFDPELNYLYSFGSSPLPNAMRDGFNPFFPVLRWDVINGNKVVCGYMKEYEIKIFDAKGNVIRKILKEYAPLEVIQEDVEERLRGEDLPPSLKENMSIPKHHCPFRRIITDDEGRIFVWTWERAEAREGYYHDVFDSEGKYIIKIPLKTRPFVLKKNKLYTVEEDEEGFQIIKRYKLNWNI